VNSLPKTVARQRRGCDLNPGPSAPESSTLTTRLPSDQSSGSKVSADVNRLERDDVTYSCDSLSLLSRVT